MQWLPAAYGIGAGLAFFAGLGLLVWFRHRRLQNDKRLSVAFERARVRREREQGERLYETSARPIAIDY